MCRAQESSLTAAVAHRRNRRRDCGNRLGGRKLVDEVQTKANASVHVPTNDFRLSRTLGEPKAVIDHVAEKVAQLDFMLQRRRNTSALSARARAGRRIEQQSACCFT